MKRKYDLIFSIGGTCACSQILRAAGLQHTSFPYDWTGCADFRFKADYLCEGFPGMMDRDSLRIGESKELGRSCWQNSHKLLWPHDLHLGVPLDEQYPSVCAKYTRRIERLLRLLGSAHRVLVVYVDNRLFPTPTEDDIRYAQQKLASRWPNAGIEFLFIRNADKVKPDDARITDRSGYRIIELDCCSYDPALGADHVNKVLGAYLRGLYEVVDYRTPAEKREGPRKRRLAKYGKFAAKTFWGYHWNRLQYKLYHHLHNRMKRKGLA